MHRQDLSTSSGGLLVYIRGDIPHRRVKHSEIKSDGLESLCIEVKIGKTKTLICSVYKHPKVSNAYFKQCVFDICDKVTPGSDDVIIIGDMNCCPTKSSLIKDICDIYGLTNLIKDPTSHKGPISILLDVILVSNPKRYVGVLNEKFDISDHHNIIGAATRRHAPFQKPKKIYYRSYKHFCENDYLNDIASAPFHVAHVFDDIDDIAWFHSWLIRNVIDSHAPIKSKIMRKRSVPYMNSKLSKAQFARNMARNKFKRFGGDFWEENKRYRNNVVNIIKKSLSNYFATRCEKHDERFWKTVSPFMSDKKFQNGCGITLEEDGETISEASKVSEVFNEFFISVASEIGLDENIVSVTDAIHKYKGQPSVEQIKKNYSDDIRNFDFQSVDADSVMLLIKKLDSKKATGYDNIPGKLIKIAHQELANSLCNLINYSMKLKCFPSIMKSAEETPVYKKENNLKRDNYRPLSILTVISKLYENVLNTQMVNHFYVLFNELLAAFRKSYSCQTLLI